MRCFLKAVFCGIWSTWNAEQHNSLLSPSPGKSVSFQQCQLQIFWWRPFNDVIASVCLHVVSARDGPYCRPVVFLNRQRKQPNHEVTYHVRLLAYTCPVCLSGIIYGYKSPSDTNVLFLCTTSFNNAHTLLRRNAYGNTGKNQRNTW